MDQFNEVKARLLNKSIKKLTDPKLLIYVCKLGLCDVDKKNCHDFLILFFDFDLNHDFDTNRHALQF